METNAKAMKTVFTVTERAGKSYWTRVGFGSQNRDGSWNLTLEAIPVNGKLQVRDWEERRDGRDPDAIHANNAASHTRRARDLDAPLA